MSIKKSESTTRVGIALTSAAITFMLSGSFNPSTARNRVGIALALAAITFMLLGSFDPSTAPNTLQSSTSRDVFPEKLVVDIISIGSQSRPEYQDAQDRTFATHETVRHFFRMTESDDSDADCHKTLTNEDAVNIAVECRRGSNPPFVKTARGPQTRLDYLNTIRTQKFYKDPELLKSNEHAAGWICAQKRPADGFSATHDYYKGHNEELPDFLFIVDDDTFINMELVTDFLRKNDFRPSTARVVAGCMMRFPAIGNFPWGGMGLFFSRAALENIFRPLHCESKNKDEFEMVVCDQLSKDLIGEEELFEEGMSISDLLRAYVVHEKYTSYRSWTKGFCFHSDWLWGYFVNYYPVSVDMSLTGAGEDRMGAYDGSEIGWKSRTNITNTGQCQNKRQATKESHFAHFLPPEEMFKLAWAQKLQTPDRFRNYGQ
eukprot:CAMPEP_0113599688 /NCGR_PEP_ID=MMETSP0015_2-20120614/42287_1 /TAXON_ID=2838 /ORGANISM="Odontella" /LENGTH=430 /DNA_ID=CAMNT_0000507855 /DNA_START=254 /DNA_END=1546 /DNA_ORIENTATION=- /assembly_acc=CAM_ASM_000160